MAEEGNDDFDTFMARSLSGGSDLFRASKSLPCSPHASPRTSPISDQDIGFPLRGDKPPANGILPAPEDRIPPRDNGRRDSSPAAHYSHLLRPPDPLQEIQGTLTTSGARPKLPRLSGTHAEREDLLGSVTVPPVTHIRRTQSCRRPASSARQQERHHRRPEVGTDLPRGNKSRQNTATKLSVRETNGAIPGEEDIPENETLGKADANGRRQDYYRQYAQRNAWRQRTHSRSTDEELDDVIESPGSHDRKLLRNMSTDSENEPDENVVGECKIYRVRSFKTTSGGIVNKGDSFKVKSRKRPPSTKRPRSRPPREGSPEGYDRRGSQEICVNGADDYRPKSRETSPIPSRPRSPQARLAVDSTLASPEPPDFEGSPGTRHGTIVLDQTLPLMDRISENPSPCEERSILSARTEEDEEEDDGPVFKVLFLGANGVGKTTLTRQLLTSEYLANSDNPQGKSS